MTYDFIDRRDYEEAVEAERLAATWTDGPNSEAARAARGEGALRGTDYRAMWDEAVELVELAAAETPDQLLTTMMHIQERHEGISSDPAHVPAVRRVVAWEVPGDSGPFDDEAHAYQKAARVRMWGYDATGSSERFRNRLSRHKHPGRYADYVRDRLAQRLRHRDEKAGYR